MYGVPFCLLSRNAHLTSSSTHSVQEAIHSVQQSQSLSGTQEILLAQLASRQASRVGLGRSRTSSLRKTILFLKIMKASIYGSEDFPFQYPGVSVRSMSNAALRDQRASRSAYTYAWARGNLWLIPITEGLRYIGLVQTSQIRRSKASISVVLRIFA